MALTWLFPTPCPIPCPMEEFQEGNNALNESTNNVSIWFITIVISYKFL